MNKPYNYGEIQEITLQRQKVGEDVGLLGSQRLGETEDAAVAVAEVF